MKCKLALSSLILLLFAIPGESQVKHPHLYHLFHPFHGHHHYYGQAQAQGLWNSPITIPINQFVPWWPGGPIILNPPGDGSGGNGKGGGAGSTLSPDVTPDVIDILTDIKTNVDSAVDATKGLKGVNPDNLKAREIPVKKKRSP